MTVSVSYTDVFGGTPVLPSQESLNTLTLDRDIALDWPTSFRNNNNVTADILEVHPNANGHTITFPNAEFVSIGKVIRVVNPDPALTFQINKFDGTGLTPVLASQTLYIYLGDNTTPGGAWRIIPLGAGFIAGGIQDFSATVIGNGLAIAGSPVVPVSGALTFELSLSLQALSSLLPLANGLIVWNGTNFGSRFLEEGFNIDIVNNDGVAGNPVISLDNDIDLNTVTCSELIAPLITSPANIIFAPTNLLLNKQIPLVAGKVDPLGNPLAGFGFSCIHTGTGTYQIIFTVPFADTNYIVTATIRSAAGTINTDTVAPGSFFIVIRDTAGTLGDAGFFFSILKV